MNRSSFAPRSGYKIGIEINDKLSIQATKKYSQVKTVRYTYTMKLCVKYETMKPRMCVKYAKDKTLWKSNKPAFLFKMTQLHTCTAPRS